MSRRLLLPLAVVALAAVVAIPAWAATPTVAVKDDFFAPKTLTIKRGQSVRFVWRGKSLHNIIASKSGRRVWSIGTRTKGTATKRFATAGRYSLLCSIHAPRMKMTVIVRRR